MGRRDNREAVLNERGAQQLTFRFADPARMTEDSTLSAYLESANLRYIPISRSALVMGRVTQFPGLTFAQVTLPQSRVVWPRDSYSVDRAAALIVLSGSVTVTTDGSIVSRGMGTTPVFFIPAGDSEVVIEFHAPQNDIFYVSLDAAAVLDLRRSPVDASLSSVESSSLVPLVAVSQRLCALSIMQGADVDPLRRAAAEVAYAIARLIAGKDQHQSIFDRAMQIVTSSCHDSTLDTTRLASMLNVSKRKLQMSFEERAVTVAAVLREARTSLALQIQDSHPGISLHDLARAAGFGSTASLRRALSEARQIEINTERLV